MTTTATTNNNSYRHQVTAVTVDGPVGVTRYEKICHPLVGVVSIGLNIPPFVLAIMGIVDWCEFYSRWLLGNGFLCIINILAAYYSIYKLRKKVCYDISRYNADNEDDEAEDEVEQQQDTAGVAATTAENQQQQNVENKTATVHTVATTGEVVATKNDDDNRQQLRQARSSNSSSSSYGSCFKRLVKFRTVSSNRIRHLVCYNGLITTYGILFLFWGFWLGIGIQINVTDGASAGDDELEGCTRSILANDHDYITISVVLGYSYFTFVMVCLFASYCDPHTINM
jgi:hypothetical protein